MDIDQTALTKWVKAKLKSVKSFNDARVLLELADDFNLFDVDSELAELNLTYE